LDIKSFKYKMLVEIILKNWLWCVSLLIINLYLSSLPMLSISLRFRLDMWLGWIFVEFSGLDLIKLYCLYSVFIWLSIKFLLSVILWLMGCSSFSEISWFCMLSPAFSILSKLSFSYISFIWLLYLSDNSFESLSNKKFFYSVKKLSGDIWFLSTSWSLKNKSVRKDKSLSLILLLSCMSIMFFIV
jgi:hypothetical protein